MAKIKTPSFEEQIHNKSTVESHGGIANYTYFKNESPREGVLPVLVAGGWSEGTASLRDSAEVVYKDGRSVILVDHARDGRQKDQTDNTNPETAQRAHTLLGVLDAENLKKVDVIAHSQGALDAVVAAKLHPERFNSIVLVAPAGLIGEDSVPRLVSRFVPKIIRGITKDAREIKQRDPESAKRFANAGPSYIKANPMKGLREVGAIARTQIDQDLLDLREAGIKIAVLQSQGDRGFPANRIGKQVIIHELEGNIDAYASVAAKDAGHDDLIIHPERATQAAVDLLNSLSQSFTRY